MARPCWSPAALPLLDDPLTLILQLATIAAVLKGK
jgi:hypothetical protein